MFVSQNYHERVFSGLAESIFERYKLAVDTLLAQRTGDVLQKIPVIYGRLSEGDPEAIRHALRTCRRMIDSFADAMFPPKGGEMEVAGENFRTGARDTKDRLRAYIKQQSTSSSREEKLQRTLGGPL